MAAVFFVGFAKKYYVGENFYYICLIKLLGVSNKIIKHG